MSVQSLKKSPIEAILRLLLITLDLVYVGGVVEFCAKVGPGQGVMIDQVDEHEEGRLNVISARLTKTAARIA